MNSGIKRRIILNTIIKAISMIIWCLSCFLALFFLFAYLGLESYDLYFVVSFLSYVAYRLFFLDFVRAKKEVSVLEAIQFVLYD